MKFLKKMLFAIALMIVLAGIKKLLTLAFPLSQVFHYNLVSSLQLLLLLWAVFTGVLESLAWRKFPARKAFIKSLVIFIAVIAVAESACIFLFNHPQRIPSWLTPAFEQYYNNYSRDILQYNRQISEYDTALFYRMKPNNRSLFSNKMFSDSIFTEEHGFRNAPVETGTVTTICLGDSYTLGWGTEQNECYPRQLETILKSPVLNTGMSSYGTAREVESVRHLHLSNLQNVVIQFCNNDIPENESYVQNNYKLQVSPRSVYDSACNVLYWSNLYFPGKYFCTISKLLLRSKPEAVSKTTVATLDGKKAAHDFLAIIKNAGWDFEHVRLVVFNIDEAYDPVGFIPELEQQLEMPENKSFFKDHVYVIHIASLFAPSDYYPLDKHLKVSGHQKLASAIAARFNNAH